MTKAGKRGRLQAKLARSIALAVVVSLVVSTAGIVLYRASSMRRSLEVSARHFSLLVSAPLTQMVIMYGPDGTEDPLENRIASLFQLNQDVVSMEIVRDDGVSVFKVSRNGIGDRSNERGGVVLNDFGLHHRVASDVQRAQRLRVGGRTVYRVVVPGFSADPAYGLSLVANFSYERVNQQLRRGAFLLLLALSLGLLVTHRVSVALARGITRNLADLQVGVRRIRAGRLDERVEIHSDDEIEELAEAFNEMTEDLQQSIGRLRRVNRELQALDQVKVDLVANVSHELRTPLTALKGFLELLGDGELGPLEPEAHRAVTVCRRNVDRLTLRVEDLVALAQMEKSWQDSAPSEPFDLIPLITLVVETYEVRMRSKGLRLVLETPAALPIIVGDAEQIERVIINLLDNAVKFTPEGGAVSISVEECDHDEREGVLIRVVDSGIGIPTSELVRVFDRFHQVDPSIRRRFGGMGLGLSLVHHIVESHHGVVWAESEDGAGASFFVWLPSRPPEAVAEEDGGEDEVW